MWSDIMLSRLLYTVDVVFLCWPEFLHSYFFGIGLDGEKLKVSLMVIFLALKNIFVFCVHICTTVFFIVSVAMEIIEKYSRILLYVEDNR